ncbi:MAG: hypothetical protein O7F73_09095 [Gammaproteobacteria bacterium]|nr:hypothetical protein [Gammaproteobacteria bacterium]
MLVASGQVPDTALSGLEFIGELALSGVLRPIAGTVGAAFAASAAWSCPHLPPPARYWCRMRLSCP